MEEFIINIEYRKEDKLIGHVEICANKENANDSLIWVSDLYGTAKLQIEEKKDDGKVVLFCTT